MSTSGRKPKEQRVIKKSEFRRSFVPSTALAKKVEFDEIMMTITLTDGRLLSVPLVWFPALHDATPKQRTKCKIAGGGISLHWPDLDEDLSMAGLMAGVDTRSA